MEAKRDSWEWVLTQSKGLYMKSRIDQHQGKLTLKDLRLARKIRNRAYTHYSYVTSLEICALTGCVSARDRIRKLKASGIPISRAKFLYKTASGSNVYGWRGEQ